MTIDKIKLSLESNLKEVNTLIETSLRSDVELIDSINQYLYGVKGKQLRMVLALLSAKACGTVAASTLTCAAVVEMIHTATLLHDDVADNAPQRRGYRTVQSLYSPASSVLMGDYWLSKAILLLLSRKDFKLIQFFSTAVQELSEGELLQIQKSQSLDTTREDYINIVGKKTSSLFVAAIAGGAYSSGASQQVIEAMENYAYLLGVAFQIRDDIFDYSPHLDTGKLPGSDIRERKLTLPLLCALEEGPKEEGEELLGFIAQEDVEESLLVEKSLSFVERYSGVAKAQQQLFRYTGRARDSLLPLTDSIHKERLKRITHFVEERVE
ncbi:MAG: polyprenyl synthetase family protein [Bacteroidales bacterium]